jgi:Cu+-exporting ATPase
MRGLDVYTLGGYSTEDPNDETGGAAMIDPVCGMTVAQDTAAAAWEHEGQTYYFCSVGCMERFRGDPAHFLSMDPADRGM